MEFKNRTRELAALDQWWTNGEVLAIVWGRRRVGKTSLIDRFARDRVRVAFHTGAERPRRAELELLGRSVSAVVDGEGASTRDLDARPFVDWDDAFDHLADLARDEPFLLVLDEFPALLDVAPELPAVLRAFMDRAHGRTKLRVLLCGSAVRVMQSIEEERNPLYGRSGLTLQVHPFEPWESALMLERLSPSDRALVWGIVGGMPLYLTWWDQSATVVENLEHLACTPGGRLLTEGSLVLASDVDPGDLSRRVLHAIAAGRTKFNEIADAAGADPARTLERLVELRLVERMVPVTEDPRRTRRRVYRIADNYLAFWLGRLSRHRTAIDRGLGASIAPQLAAELDEHMGPVWEEAFRRQLVRMANAGDLGDDVVAVGRWWNSAQPPAELDAVVLSGRSRAVSAVGEAKWARRVDAGPLVARMARMVDRLPNASRGDAPPRMVVCARDEVVGDVDARDRVTAADIFTA